MREVVLDTETTGLDPGSGHRIVEIGCVELLNHVPTGQTFHCYLNPERAVPYDAFAVHGLSDEFLQDKPVFADVVDAFVDFLGDAPLVIHNASFDLGFLNAELARISRPLLAAERAIDTVALARQAFPGAPANLDALCRRFQINGVDRTQHGALKDANLLAVVYLCLRGGRQPGFKLVSVQETVVSQRRPRTPRLIPVSPEERTAHNALLTTLKNPLWQELAADGESS